MTCTGAHHQGATETFWLNFWGALMLSITYSLETLEIFMSCLLMLFTISKETEFTFKKLEPVTMSNLSSKTNMCIFSEKKGNLTPIIYIWNNKGFDFAFQLWFKQIALSIFTYPSTTPSWKWGKGERLHYIFSVAWTYRKMADCKSCFLWHVVQQYLTTQQSSNVGKFSC